MAYIIYDIQSTSPDSFPFYFIDSNVWIAQLRSLGTSPNSLDEPYVNFFEGIVSLNVETNVKVIKKIKHKPKIIVTSLLLSEIFNAYMRQIAMKLYYYQEGVKNGLNDNAALSDWKNYDFKKDYRITNDYNNQLKKLKKDFLAYNDYIQYRDDSFNQLGPKSIIESISDTSDFNDFYYYYSLIEEQIPIVTNDSDFCFMDFPIITANPKLLKINLRH